jgi:hypothetical protein
MMMSDYRSRIQQASPVWVDWHAMNAIHHTKPMGMHVDHIVPLCGENVCGLNVPWNLQYLTPEANMSKGNSIAEPQGGQGTPEFIAVCVAMFEAGLGFATVRDGLRLTLVPEVRHPTLWEASQKWVLPAGAPEGGAKRPESSIVTAREIP